MDNLKKLKHAIELTGMKAVERLKNTAPQATGGIKRNIDYKVKTEGNKIILNISFPFYAEYVNDGSPPHMPPVDAIKEWCIIKGIPEEAAWAIAMTIKKQGTHPNPFITSYINHRFIKDFKESLKMTFK